MRGVDTVLALLALVASFVAIGLVLAVRRSRGAAPPAPPPPPLPPPTPPQPNEDGAARARLDLLEVRRTEMLGALGDLAGRVERVEQRVSARGDEGHDLRKAVGRMQAAFEALTAATEAVEPESADEPGMEPEARVREHLRQAGWDDVVLLSDEPGAWRVEARRGGALAKGRARLFPDGRVEARLTPPTRAFP